MRVRPVRHRAGHRHRCRPAGRVPALLVCGGDERLSEAGVARGRPAHLVVERRRMGRVPARRGAHAPPRARGNQSRQRRARRADLRSPEHGRELLLHLPLRRRPVPVAAQPLGKGGRVRAAARCSGRHGLERRPAGASDRRRCRGVRRDPAVRRFGDGTGGGDGRRAGGWSRRDVRPAAGGREHPPEQQQARSLLGRAQLEERLSSGAALRAGIRLVPHRQHPRPRAREHEVDARYLHGGDGEGGARRLPRHPGRTGRPGRRRSHAADRDDHHPCQQHRSPTIVA